MCSQASQGQISCISFWSCPCTLTKKKKKRNTGAFHKCVCHNWVLACCIKSNRAPVCSRHNLTDRQTEFVQVSSSSSFTSFLTHAKVLQVWGFCKVPRGKYVCELAWFFIYIGAFWTTSWLRCQWSSKSQQTSVTPLAPPPHHLTSSPHSSIISHLCLLPTPDVFEHSCWVLAFFFLVFPTISSF